MNSHNGEGLFNRDEKKFRENFDAALSSGLHKDTIANTDIKRQVTGKDLPAGMKSRTIYGKKQ